MLIEADTVADAGALGLVAVRSGQEGARPRGVVARPVGARRVVAQAADDADPALQRCQGRKDRLEVEVSALSVGRPPNRLDPVRDIERDEAARGDWVGSPRGARQSAVQEGER